MAQRDLDLPFPDIPPALLERLEDQFPDRALDPSHSERELWARYGEIRLIRLLRHHFDEQHGSSTRKNR